MARLSKEEREIVDAYESGAGWPAAVARLRLPLVNHPLSFIALPQHLRQRTNHIGGQLHALLANSSGSARRNPVAIALDASSQLFNVDLLPL